MLKKLILLTITIGSLANLEAMDIGDKTVTQTDTKKQYDEKATKDLQEFVENYDTLKETATSEELAQQFQEIINRDADINTTIRGFLLQDRTPIIWIMATPKFNPALFQILLTAGADPFSIEFRGETMREVLKKYLRNADNRCPDDYINTLKSKINLLKEAEKKYLKIPIAPTAPWPFPEQETSVTAGNTPQASQKD